jgi:AcrR family transcriptional regulator
MSDELSRLHVRMSSRAYRTRRGRSSAAETRERILQAVRELLAEGTFHEATVEEIAARAGVARSTLHLHFGSRLGLVDAVCELLGGAREYAGIKSSLELADPAEALRRVLSAAVRFWAAEEDLHRSLYGLAEIDPAARAFVDRQTTGRRSDLQRLSKRLEDGGRLRPGLDENDALSLLLVATSFATFDELRRNARLTASAVEHAVARVASVLLNADRAGEESAA